MRPVTDVTKILKTAALAVLAVGAISLAAKPAEAVTTITLTGTSATLSCTGSVDPACQGYTGGGSPNAPSSLGTLSNTNADLYDLPNSNEQTEANALNTLAGTTFTKFDANKTDTGGVDSFSFFTDALYLIIKIGGGTVGADTAFFKLVAPGVITIVYDKNLQTSGGLSHLTVFGGTITRIPLPAALPLMLTALGGLFFAGRRRREAAA